jgi:multidrug resistance efflux pump
MRNAHRAIHRHGHDEGGLLGSLGTLPAMEMVEANHSARRLAYLMLALLGVTTAILIFTPWMQNVDGAGHVSALTPLERTQTISAPVDGRVAKWHVTEGTKVKAGDPIVELADNDPQVLERVERELAMVEERRMNAQSRIGSVQERLARLEEARTNAVAAARSRIQVAEDRIRGAEQSITAAQERVKFGKFNMELRQKAYEKGLTALRDVEAARQEINTAEAMLRQSEAALSASRNEKRAAEDDLKRIEADTQASVESERANLNSSRADVSNIKAEIQRTEVKVARQGTQKVTAPRDGTILRLLAQPGSEMLRAGSPLAMFVPDAYSPTVELWLNGMDMPLVRAGDPVRLQFNGWPAVQFVGWPSVAVGTFGGRVQLVDATETKQGLFRILVTPDEKDDPWPSAMYLRQGVQARGWVLLKNVPLWWELWRRFNGFPPVIADDEPGARAAKEKD